MDAPTINQREVLQMPHEVRYLEAGPLTPSPGVYRGAREELKKPCRYATFRHATNEWETRVVTCQVSVSVSEKCHNPVMRKPMAPLTTPLFVGSYNLGACAGNKASDTKRLIVLKSVLGSH